MQKILHICQYISLCAILVSCSASHRAVSLEKQKAKIEAKIDTLSARHPGLLKDSTITQTVPVQIPAEIHKTEISNKDTQQLAVIAHLEGRQLRKSKIRDTSIVFPDNTVVSVKTGKDSTDIIVATPKQTVQGKAKEKEVIINPAKHTNWIADHFPTLWIVLEWIFWVLVACLLIWAIGRVRQAWK
jgi:hypothetical protein